LGARATKDGFGLIGGVRIGGNVSQIPMEVFETRYPFFVEEYSIVQDSGGPGKFRGGLSAVEKIRPVKHTCEIGGCNDRAVIPPYGLFGGMPGLHGDNRVTTKSGKVTQVDRAGGVIATQDDLISFRAPGGGGYGDPLDRDLNLLKHDVFNGYVSIESARRDYGAVIDEVTLVIDEEATKANRCKLKADKKRENIFIDQMTQPFAGRAFRILYMNKEGIG